MKRPRLVLALLATLMVGFAPAASRAAGIDLSAHRLVDLTQLGALPPRGATVIALPMKIAGGSGGPLRAIALVPKR